MATDDSQPHTLSHYMLKDGIDYLLIEKRHVIYVRDIHLHWRIIYDWKERKESILLKTVFTVC